ncbi:hypothetical protein ABAC402_18215 [Asticcacaulis sp. AC402]|nr:hypothetical protein ABAC402_18215 [Asticcacaulis sp. AC402]
MHFTFAILVIIYGICFEIPGWESQYLFHTLRDPPPLFWWPVRTQVVMFGLIGFNLFLFVLSRTQWRERLRYWAEGLLAIGLVAMVAAIAINTTSGVAIYTDRAESTLLTFKGYENESLRYRDVRFVTLGCKIVNTRGAEATRVFYALHGEHGAVVNLEQGLDKRTPDANWLRAVHAADAAIPGTTIRRELTPLPDSAGQYKRCIDRFRQDQAEGDKALVTEIFERPEVIGLL